MADLPERESFNEEREATAERLNRVDTEAYTLISTHDKGVDTTSSNMGHEQSWRYENEEFEMNTELAMLLYHFKLVGEKLEQSEEELARYCITEYEGVDLSL
ncbi:hypothetical protein BRC86_03400 [Halobacteriales archaeon QS_3_64_16]|nr:MAG: hypothetical protein BRC86_03400 [Halobacteriales archaeon QS_3_64_16]